MNKKNMYIIIKREDAQKYLSNDEIKKLVGMLEKISDGRMEDNKHQSNTYYVCNTDEPYADAVHNVILGGEALKNGSSYCTDACGTSYVECFHTNASEDEYGFSDYWEEN